jgi:hypothetical protein
LTPISRTLPIPLSQIVSPSVLRVTVAALVLPVAELSPPPASRACGD